MTVHLLTPFDRDTVEEHDEDDEVAAQFHHCCVDSLHTHSRKMFAGQAPLLGHSMQKQPLFHDI